MVGNIPSDISALYNQVLLYYPRFGDSLWHCYFYFFYFVPTLSMELFVLILAPIFVRLSVSTFVPQIKVDFIDSSDFLAIVG